MNWFFIALTAPFFWAIANHTDKYLLSKFVKGGGIGSLIIFSCFFSALVLPIIGYFQPHVLDVSSINILILLITGVINAMGVLFYLYALNHDEASIIAPFFQMYPVIAFILGYVVLGEKVTNINIVGSILIIIGSIALSFDFKSKYIEIKSKILALMTLSAILFALHGVLFKLVVLKETFWLSSFWEYAGLLLTGILFFVFSRKYRNEFIYIIKHYPAASLLINFINEVFVFIGNLATAYALTIAPVAIVLAVSGFQPLFVLIIGIIITIFFPKIGKEDISYRSLVYKFVPILVIIIGGYILNMNTV